MSFAAMAADKRLTEPHPMTGRVIHILKRCDRYNLLLIAVYVFIYILFVWKYSGESRPMPSLTLIAYLVVAPVAILLAFRRYRWRFPVRTENLVYFSVVALVAAVLVYLMNQFEPEQIAIGRYQTMHDWIARLIEGEHPYAQGRNHPSALPFWFVLAIPFFLLGDVGLLQIAAFVGFAFVIHRRQTSLVSKFRVLLLLIVAPVFLFEVTVRSDLLSNMLFAALFLGVFERYGKDNRPFRTIWLGILGGLMLATRGVVLIPFIIYFGNMARRTGLRWVALLCAMALSFFVSWLPFLVWDPDPFLNYGPFATQLSHIPTPLLAVTLLFCGLCAVKAKSLRTVYAATAFTLFAVVFVKLIMSIMTAGIIEAILHDNQFDMAYFAFCIPFLLLALKFPENSGDSSMRRSRASPKHLN